MATRTDFTETEWDALERGLTGSGMLVSISDRDFTDTFGEAGALGRYLAGQQVAGTTALLRELAKAHGTGFGITTSPDEIRSGTLDALRSAVAALQAKAPEELDGYRQMVVGVAQAVADAKGGETGPETAVISQIREALGS